MSNTINKTYTSIENIQASSEKTQATSKNDLDKNAFLNLLVTQMRYQDPLNPTNDREFLAQMAQFTALEQMQNLNQNFSFSQGVSMVGKEIKAAVGNELTGEIQQIEGIVEGARQKNGKTFLVVGDQDIPLEKVQQVINPMEWSYQDPFSLIGKVVQVQWPIQEEGEEIQLFEGMVEHIQIKDGQPHIVIADSLFSMEDVLGVVESTSLVGKWIEVKSKDQEIGDKLQVDAVKSVQDQVILVSGEQEFNMKEIQRIFNEP